MRISLHYEYLICKMIKKLFENCGVSLNIDTRKYTCTIIEAFLF
jgi:hypothetical protein